MSELIMEIDEKQEFDDMGSYNHSLVQSNLSYLLRKYTEFSAFNELSLDVSTLDKAKFPYIKDDLIPDVCAYPRRSVMDNDIMRMAEMPVLAIEVVSPRQGILTIVEKLQAYFALGVQSCWLVEPITRVVRVYHPNAEPKTYSDGDLVDEVVHVKFPLAEIFK